MNAALVCHSSRTRSVTLRNADCSGGSDGPGCLETARKQEITGIRPRSEEEVRSERLELLLSSGLQGGSDLRCSQFTSI